MITVSTLLELPENVYQTLKLYLLTHSEVDRDQFVAEAINDALLLRLQAELRVQAISQQVEP